MKVIRWERHLDGIFIQTEADPPDEDTPLRGGICQQNSVGVIQRQTGSVRNTRTDLVTLVNL